MIDEGMFGDGMKNLLLIVSLVLVPDVLAQECWRADRFQGYQAHQFDGTNEVDNYEFKPDAFYTGSSKPMEKGFVVVCFTSSSASIWHSYKLNDEGIKQDELRKSGNKYVVFGKSTFIRFSNPLSQEHVDVYQLDRVNKKMMYIKSSSPQDDKNPAWGKTSSYVGRAVMVNKGEAKKYATIMF
jgi:hypothetical protein